MFETFTLKGMLTFQSKHMKTNALIKLNLSFWNRELRLFNNENYFNLSNNLQTLGGFKHDNAHMKFNSKQRE